jgi:hypothetical protein
VAQRAGLAVAGRVMRRMLALVVATACGTLAVAQPQWPITERQRDAAERVAQAGVPLADLAPDAPQRHTVQPGDTLWSLAKLFLKSPWRWPELWGMNLEQVRNPHRIFPGQTLLLLRDGERARLVLASAQGTGHSDGPAGAPGGEAAAGLPTVRISPRARGEMLPALSIAPVSARALAPFLSETVVLETDDLARAPRIVGALDGRLLLSQGETAYVRGELGDAQDFRVFRAPVPLRDPATGELLGYEARYVGRARTLRSAPTSGGAAVPAGEVVPTALRLTHTRLEATVGDRLAPAETADWAGFVPRAPGIPVEARVVSFVGEGLSASQKQIVSVNRGTRDGMERGHVLSLWRAGQVRADPADPKGPRLRFPDERHGTVMLVRVFDRVSYALVLDIGEPVRIGDRLTQP